MCFVLARSWIILLISFRINALALGKYDYHSHNKRSTTTPCTELIGYSVFVIEKCYCRIEDEKRRENLQANALHGIGVVLMKDKNDEEKLKRVCDHIHNMCLFIYNRHPNYSINIAKLSRSWLTDQSWNLGTMLTYSLSREICVQFVSYWVLLCFGTGGCYPYPSRLLHWQHG